jgi:hypothetical protein
VSSQFNKKFKNSFSGMERGLHVGRKISRISRAGWFILFTKGAFTLAYFATLSQAKIAVEKAGTLLHRQRW